jgi:hypothetical protein
MKFDFSVEKNDKLYKIRGITFQDIVEAVLKKGILKDFKHPNSKEYPNQRVFIVELKGYPYFVPYVTDGEVMFLKTAYPAREFKYLLENENE